LSSPLAQRIVISPIGSQDSEVLSLLGRDIGRFFGFETEIIPLLENIDFAIDFKRNQYHSTVILEKLAEQAPDDTLKILAITEFDLFIPIFTYVFGEAQLGGKACIISTHRLSQELPPMEREEGFKIRVVKEALHELGHTFKLKHCKEKHCIMRYSRSIEDVDNKSKELCRYCRRLLDDEMDGIRNE
jgi:archaemetzincin